MPMWWWQQIPPRELGPAGSPDWVPRDLRPISIATPVTIPLGRRSVQRPARPPAPVRVIGVSQAEAAVNSGQAAQTPTDQPQAGNLTTGGLQTGLRAAGLVPGPVGLGARLLNGILGLTGAWGGGIAATPANLVDLPAPGTPGGFITQDIFDPAPNIDLVATPDLLVDSPSTMAPDTAPAPDSVIGPGSTSGLGPTDIPAGIDIQPDGTVGTGMNVADVTAGQGISSVDAQAAAGGIDQVGGADPSAGQSDPGGGTDPGGGGDPGGDGTGA